MPRNISLGIDTIIIANTGGGKTIPVVLPLLEDPDSAKAIIVSPLTVMEDEQVEKFTKMGFTAIAIKKDVWDRHESAGIRKVSPGLTMIACAYNTKCEVGCS